MGLLFCGDPRVPLAAQLTGKDRGTPGSFAGRAAPKRTYWLLPKVPACRFFDFSINPKRNCLGAPVFRDKIGIFVPVEAKIFDA